MSVSFESQASQNTRKRYSQIESTIFTQEEDAIICRESQKNGSQSSQKQWAHIAALIPDKTPSQIAKRWTNVLDKRIAKGAWTEFEDKQLKSWVDEKGESEWSNCARTLLPWRTGKQCRERWTNQLRPGIKNTAWTTEEDQMLTQLYNRYGPKWVLIHQNMPDRSQNQLKSRWSSLQKRMRRLEMGEPPILKPGRRPQRTLAVPNEPIDIDILSPTIFGLRNNLFTEVDELFNLDLK